MGLNIYLKRHAKKFKWTSRTIQATNCHGKFSWGHPKHEPQCCEIMTNVATKVEKKKILKLDYCASQKGDRPISSLIRNIFHIPPAVSNWFCIV